MVDNWCSRTQTSTIASWTIPFPSDIINCVHEILEIVRNDRENNKEKQKSNLKIGKNSRKVNLQL